MDGGEGMEGERRDGGGEGRARAAGQAVAAHSDPAWGGAAQGADPEVRGLRATCALCIVPPAPHRKLTLFTQHIRLTFLPFMEADSTLTCVVCVVPPAPHRKLRLFAQQDLPALIEQEGVQPAAADSVFSLEVFDNTDFETRLPEDWVPRGAGEGAWCGWCGWW